MLEIYCPYCQEVREEEEFSYGGEAHIQRPLEPEALSDEQWGDYLFFRKNPKGIHHEMWYHAAGCRRYFNVTRNTLSYEILEVYPMGTQPKVTASSAKHANTTNASTTHEKNAVVADVIADVIEGGAR